MNKESILLLMNGYVDAIKRDNCLYETLDRIGISFSVDADPLNHAVEKILTDELGGDICSALFDFACDSEVVFIDDKKATTVEEIYEVYKG